MVTDKPYEPTDEEVKQAVARLLEQKGKRVAYAKKRNELVANDPVMAEKIKNARKTYNQSERAKERRKAYYKANKEKIYASHKAYHAKQKALLARAKEMGLIPEKGAAA